MRRSIDFFRIFGVFTILLISRPVFARVYDLYRADGAKGAFCSVIGGACSANTEIESGFYQNPASLSSDTLTWAVDADYNGSKNLEPGMKSANGITQGTYTGGVGRAGPQWGAAVVLVEKREEFRSSVSVTDSLGLTQRFPLTATSTSLDFRVPVSYRVNPRLNLGIGLSASLWSQSLIGENGSRADITRQSDPIRWSLRIGGIYRSPGTDWSYGAWFKLPSTRYSHLSFDTQAYSNSLHYEEDIAIHDPWILDLGANWTPWSDGRKFFFDLKTIGPTTDGYLLTYDTFSTAFGESQLQAKGRSLVCEPRFGFQKPLEWRNGRKSNLFMGSFFESSRWENQSGRIHLTGGLSYEAISGFEFMIGGDVAKNFGQIFITFR